MFTVDASVYINALNPNESDSSQSQAFLELVQVRRIPVIGPTLLRVEVAAALARALADPQLAVRMADTICALPGHLWQPLDESLAEESAVLAAEHRLRGADAVYAAIARRGGLTLVTRDRQQLERVTGAVVALTPAAAFEALTKQA
jgi:predicted nucleic acid-binding protein